MQVRPRALFAEFVGTFLLTFVDAGIALVNSSMVERIDYLARCLAPALVVMTVIFTLGGISGAHINPAVTFAFTLRGEFRVRRMSLYMAAQLAGAVSAALLLWGLFGSVEGGLTLPRVSTGLACACELILTAFLIFTILSVCHQTNIKGPEAAFPVGFTLVIANLIAKGLTGASFNPARSLGVAIVAQDFQSIWIYLLMPFAGSFVGVSLIWLLCGSPNEKEKKKALHG